MTRVSEAAETVDGGVIEGQGKAGAPKGLQLVAGRIVGDRYLVENQLGEGGMGSVHAARHVELGTPVIIKFMRRECLDSPSARTRFLLEAKAAANLNSPNIVRVLDYGVDDGEPYIVMERLQGEDLERRLFRRGRISPEEAHSILRQAAKGLRRAHESGFIHRDIKPANIFLSIDDDNEEIVKLLDFGIAKQVGPGVVGNGTREGVQIGTPYYMSPEQVYGESDIDWRTDIWSLGVVLFEAVTGARPFFAEPLFELWKRIIEYPIPKATDIAPELPSAMDEFFLTALHRDRSRRFQSAIEMVEAFRRVIDLPSVPPPSTPPSPPITPPSPPIAPPSPLPVTNGDSGADRGDQAEAVTSLSHTNERAMRRWLGPSIVVMVVGVLIVVATVYSGRPDRPDSDPIVSSEGAPSERREPPVAPVFSSPSAPSETVIPTESARPVQPTVTIKRPQAPASSVSVARPTDPAPTGGDVRCKKTTGGEFPKLRDVGNLGRDQRQNLLDTSVCLGDAAQTTLCCKAK